MTALDFMVFICVSVLLFEGGFSEEQVFFRSGQMAIIPFCHTRPLTCSNVDWFDNNNQRIQFQEGNGQIPPKDVKFHLTSICSLVINNISDVDAGGYGCRPDKQRPDQDTLLYVNILTVSKSPPDTDPNTDGNITLQCSLKGRRSSPCTENSVRWVNEDGSVLKETRSFIREEKCVSTITVKRPSGYNRRYTCQFMDKNQVQISADHTLVSITEEKATIPYPEYIGAAVGVVVLLVVIAIIVKMRCRKRDKDTAKQTDGFQNQNHPTVEPEINLTYAMFDHKNTGSSKQVIKQDAVMYSTVNTQVKMETDNDIIYSTVT